MITKQSINQFFEEINKKKCEIKDERRETEMYAYIFR